MGRKKESRKPVIIGFAVTVIILFSLFFGLVLIRPGVPVSTLPASIPRYSALWGTYVPASAQLFGWENYTAIREYNASYPTQYTVLLDILDVNLKLRPAAIDSVVTVSFAQPNESIAFAFVNQAAFNNFTSAFSGLSYTAVQAGNSTMYYVRDYSYGQTQYGWLALIPADRGIAFAVGGADAKQALLMTLTLKPSDAMINTMNVRQMLYVANGTAGHLALGIQNFAGVLPLANRTLTVIDSNGSQMEIRRVLEFNSTNTAVAQYGNVKQGYLNAHAFTVFGSALPRYSSFVLATQFEAMSDLSGAVRLVE
ncbi:MAG: hypothetical protein JRN08_06140 [Nitrososphaerota archaeon]|nr:hypothetical protein [Nitrososphaerota archaeon]